MVIAGWRIRWGMNQTNIYGSLTVNFSSNFSTIPYIYLSQVGPVFNTGDPQKNILAENITISSFDCKLGEDGGGNGGGKFCWLAIGGS